MSIKQKIIYISLLIILIVYGVKFIQNEQSNANENVIIAKNNFTAAQIDNFQYEQIDELSKLDKLAINHPLPIGHYIVGETINDTNEMAIPVGRYALVNNNSFPVTVKINDNEIIINENTKNNDYNFIIYDFQMDEEVYTYGNLELKSVGFFENYEKS